jgi:Lipopolysaccharide-assembly
MKKVFSIYFFIGILIAAIFTGCKWFPYKFNDVSIDPKLKTFKVIYFENKARYVNPQLTPKITDKLRQKITAQTKLSPTSGDAHLEISGYINEYSVSTSGVTTGNNASSNRLNVGVTVEIKNNLDPSKTVESTITRNFDFAAGLNLAQAEAQLSDDIVKNVVDEIFNKIFSNW